MRHTVSKTLVCIGSAIAASTLTAGAQAAADSPALSDATVGDCLAISDNRPDHTLGSRVDCGAPDATYRVYSVHDTLAECPSDEYTSYTEQNGTGVLRLCLAPAFHQGYCYNDVATSPYMQVPCGTADATFLVVLRVDGSTDPIDCPADADQYISVPDPATLFCLTSSSGVEQSALFPGTGSAQR